MMQAVGAPQNPKYDDEAYISTSNCRKDCRKEKLVPLDICIKSTQYVKFSNETVTLHNRDGGFPEPCTTL